MGVAIAFIIFKRFDKAEKVFEVIRQVKPSKLFVIADGSRAEYFDEAEKCEATRLKLFLSVCVYQFKVLFPGKNLEIETENA
jgi:hypothetical protein